MKLPRSMWDVEAEHPWLVAVYFAAVFGAILLCHLLNGGFE